jgi:uncharacterized protein (TIGR03032 family)
MTQSTIDMEATPGFAAWLATQGISLAFTSYRAGKLITLGSGADGTLTASDCALERCMGLGVGLGRLWVASTFRLWRFDSVLEPGQAFQGHDAVFLPANATTTGAVDVHDIAETPDRKPVFVVPRFNCLATLAEGHSFEVLWKPPFIDAMIAEDRCHLNGLAMQDGVPRYVTCVAPTNTSGAWRDHRNDGGVVVDVDTNAIVAEGLSMPHSPRLHNGQLWLHQSGTGTFGRIDLATGGFTPVAQLNGFPRGLAFQGKWAIIGLSKPRSESGFDDLALGRRLQETGQEPECAILCLNLETGEIDYRITIGPDVDEIYDVAILPNIRNPLLVDPNSEEVKYFIRPKIIATTISG